MEALGGWDEPRAELDRRILTALEGNNFRTALALTDSLAASGERSPRVLGQRARALGGLGRYDEAVAGFEEAILADYEGCENHIHFAIFLMRNGKTGRAHTEFMEAKVFCDASRRPLIYRNLAVANIKLEKPVEALQYVEDGLAEAPADSYLLGLKAMLIARQRPADAESLFAMVFAAGDLSSEFLVQYGLLLLNEGRADEAVRAFERAASEDVVRREIDAYLAEALDQAGRPREAESILRKLLDNGDDADLRERLAGVLFHAGSYADALEIYGGLAETAETMDRMAMCLHNLGRDEEAISWARKANLVNPDWPQAMINLAVILAAKGELAEARSLLERAVAIDPENVAARVNLERLRDAGRRLHEGAQ